jgi:DNA-binding response OmpR family regulator
MQTTANNLALKRNVSTAPGRSLFAIVEDEPFMAELVSDMLSSGDVNFEVFHCGSELLKSPNLQWFKAIILDLSLPDIDGFELMNTLAADAEGMSMVLMSGHDLAVLRAAKIYGNGIGLKVRSVLTKPFTKDQLFDALGLLLRTEQGQAI